MLGVDLIERGPREDVGSLRLLRMGLRQEDRSGPEVVTTDLGAPRGGPRVVSAGYFRDGKGLGGGAGFFAIPLKFYAVWGKVGP